MKIAIRMIGALAMAGSSVGIVHAQEESFFQGLGSVEGSTLTAVALSADGMIVVGDAAYIGRAFRWTRGGGVRLLPEIPIKYSGITAQDVSLDGTIVGGFESKF
jgi:hypothetical protein